MPTPFDPRLLFRIPPAVAKAAMKTGVATKPITDWTAYEHELRHRFDDDSWFINKANARKHEADR